jgi:Ser/Thr protein kinase RdoA (MazF antagonist)
MVRNAPQWTVDDAARVARELFGVEGAASALPSERDQNFRIGDGHVLKVANAAESPAFLDAQAAAFARLRSAETGLRWPDVSPAREVDGHLVRLLSWIPGTCLAAADQSPETLASLGRALANIATALADFDHPAAHRNFHWDLRQAP